MKPSKLDDTDRNDAKGAVDSEMVIRAGYYLFQIGYFPEVQNRL